MKVAVIYDTVYGNTESIAKAIGDAIDGDVRVSRVGNIDGSGLSKDELVVIGSPTLGGRPSQPMQDFLAKIPGETLKGLRFAAFDTRYTGSFVKMFGFAADKIAESLVSKGASLASTPQAFYVTGKKGPLKEGELQHASSWAKELVK